MYDVCKSELATNRFRDGQMETQEGKLGQDLELGRKSGKGMNEYQGHISQTNHKLLKVGKYSIGLFLEKHACNHHITRGSQT